MDNVLAVRSRGIVRTDTSMAIGVIDARPVVLAGFSSAVIDLGAAVRSGIAGGAGTMIGAMSFADTGASTVAVVVLRIITRVEWDATVVALPSGVALAYVTPAWHCCLLRWGEDCNDRLYFFVDRVHKIIMYFWRHRNVLTTSLTRCDTLEYRLIPHTP
jgi:hypothetical protein